jgi:segregation and condensation protein B
MSNAEDLPATEPAQHRRDTTGSATEGDEMDTDPGVPATPGLGDGPDITSSPSQGSVDSDAEPSLPAALEAILMVVDTPVSDAMLAEVLDRPREDVGEALRTLAGEYLAHHRGFELREVAGGWRFYSAASCAPYVERFVRDGQPARLTQASLETLAVVAYRQPVSRARISAVRGVNVEGVMRTLIARGLIEEAGTEPESGAILYQTTTYFLERLGLPSLDDLPELATFLPDLESLEAETI